eukprot:COSAG01_NODE_6905_length_3444_cov_19.912108_7_plen_72_part_00
MPRSSFRYVEKGQRGSVVFGAWQCPSRHTHTHTYIRVRVEIMGSQKCRMVRKSLPVLILTNPIIITSTRII